MWQVIFLTEFQEWFDALNEAEQDSVLYVLTLLQHTGPMLGRPYVDTLQGSQMSHLKELRIQHQGKPYRAFFAFDPLRQAVMLCAGDKTGDKRFYQRMIPLAETIYDNYLKEQDL